MKGFSHTDDKNKKWLRVVEIQQANTTEFVPAPEGAWTEWDGGPHNGGQWLHPISNL